MIYLAIDPSVNTLGVAIYDAQIQEYNWKQINVQNFSTLPQKLADIQMQVARFVRAFKCNLSEVKHLICEYPQFMNSQKGSVAAVMGYTHDLAAICGYMAAVCKFANVTFYTPQQWKGNLTKEAIEFRFKRLFPTTPLPSDHEQEATMMIRKHITGSI